MNEPDDYDLTRALDDVERLLRDATELGRTDLTELMRETLAAGGKRIRPRLVLLMTLACRPSDEVPEAMRQRSQTAAAAVELLHTATLYHDDVIDGATLRRGRPSVAAEHGADLAILGGDGLLALAMCTGATLGPTETQILARSLLDICCGQLSETAGRFNLSRSLDDYRTSVTGKTAQLFAASCELGAAIGGGDCPAARHDSTRAAARSFGLHLGIAFQMINDLLDIVESVSGRTGKDGTDIANGIYSHAVIHGLELDPALGRLLARWDQEGVRQEAHARLFAAGAYAKAQASIFTEWRRAEECLGRLPERNMPSIDKLRVLGKAALQHMPNLSGVEAIESSAAAS